MTTQDPQPETPETEASETGGAAAAQGGEPAPRAVSFSGAPGAHLKKVREKLGLSLTELSDRTKITKAILSALEDERYEDLPNARVYVWGFVRCLARELELDMDEMAAVYVPRWERWVEENDVPAY